MRKTYLYLAISAVSMMSLPQTASAQFAFGGDAPIAVDAENATYKGGLTVLEGDVDVRQADVRIQSNKMDIYRAEADPGDNASVKLGDVTKIVAVGNFRYTSPENSVMGNRGVYERNKGIITVTGDVTFKTPNGATVKGERLIYNVNKKTAKFGEQCKDENCQGERVNFSSGRPVNKDDE